ncbi:hypothetical protein HAX54_001897 [Datura stramonium]|uniref:Threonyl-tRNA synthetase n=1 Tax=Datura stramonium TaxID=4076 RepID=A0ABS8RV17_DATST|nr:hypothetical protein [Datura stramonium]
MDANCVLDRVQQGEEKQPFERIEVTRQQALDMFSDNRFKASSAYWRGDKSRESLQRVYGISFPDQKQLKEYLAMLEEAKKYDHRELTKKQELFFFHPLSPGSCFFLPHGARICNKLLEFIKSQYWKRGYERRFLASISSVIHHSWSFFEFNLYSLSLLSSKDGLESKYVQHAIVEASGHAANYKENMFVFEIEKQEFGLKPMNCPGHCLIFDHRIRSYRGPDAHIFCRESQIKDEVKGVLDFISYVYKIFGFTFDLKLSTRPEKYLGDLESWEKAEAALAEALNELGSLGGKREAQVAQYNYILVVEAEVSSGQVSVRVRDKPDHQVMTVDGLLTHFKRCDYLISVGVIVSPALYYH